jgi:hypothetical protein
LNKALCTTACISHWWLRVAEVGSFGNLVVTRPRSKDTEKIWNGERAKRIPYKIIGVIDFGDPKTRRHEDAETNIFTIFEILVYRN